MYFVWKYADVHAYMCVSMHVSECMGVLAYGYVHVCICGWVCMCECVHVGCADMHVSVHVCVLRAPSLSSLRPHLPQPQGSSSLGMGL